MKKILKVILIVLLIIAAVVGFSIWHMIDKFQTATNTKESWSSGDGTVIKDISYGEAASNKFDLYIPANADQTQPQSVILFIHGGGWSGGSRGDMAFACKRYTKAGYITATIEYSLISEDHPEITMLTMVDEIDACIGALKNSIEEQGYIVDKLALSGPSAGGHLALLYAYSRGLDSAIPLVFMASQSGPVGADFGMEGITDEAAEASKPFSPIQFVKEDTVPTLLCHGRQDSIVLYEGTVALMEKLEQYHVPYDFVDYPDSNHTLESDPESHTLYHEKMLEYCKTYFGY